MKKNTWNDIIKMLNHNKVIIDIILLVFTLLTIILLFIQNNQIIKQTLLFNEQNKILNNQLRQSYFLKRVSFISTFNNNLGTKASKITSKLQNKLPISNDELSSYLDDYEYLFNFYKKYNLITPEEIDIYYKGYILTTCNSPKVVKQLQYWDKLERYHRGFKQFCCRYFSRINSKYKAYYIKACKY